MRQEYMVTLQSVIEQEYGFCIEPSIFIKKKSLQN